MANENQNTGASNLGAGQENIKRQLKELIEDQGDYNNLLKDSLRSIQSLDKTYTRIASRISALNRDTINTRQLNQELQRLGQKKFITEKNYLDLAKEVSQSAKDAVSIAEQNASSQEQVVELLKAQGDLEALALYSAKQSYEVAKDKYKLGQEELKTEREVSRQLGISGNLMKIFAEKVGVGEEAYSAMTVKARNLVEEQKNMSKTGAVFSKILGSFQVAGSGFASIMKTAFSNLLDPLAIIGIGGSLIKGLQAALNYILGIQDQTVKFARSMNLSTGEARKIKMEFASLSISSGDLFINSQKMVESQMEFVDALGVTNRLSNEQLATNIKLKDIAGLDLETRQGIVEASVLTGKSSEGITKSVLSQVAGLKQTTGISFQYQKILKEASNLGGYLGLSFSKYPAQLTKSLVTVKSMGLELKQLDSIADSFLDFESSISKEFEAQLLTGKEINLTKAREAFLNNDLATAASEITNQVGSANDFLKLNRIQAESLASAFGMSRDQMGEMLKQQELLSRLGAKDLKDAQAKVQALRAQGKSKEDIVRLTGEEAYQNLTNASLQEKIGGFMEKIKQSISDFVEKSGIIDKLEGFFDYLSKPENIKKIISGVRDFFAGAVEFIGKAAYYILEGLDYVAFGQIPDSFIDSIKSGAENMGAQIRSLGGDMGGVSVSDQTARRDVTSSAVATNVEDNMSMRRGSSKEVVNLNVTTYVSDTKRDATARYDREGNFDLQTGK